MNVRTIRDKSLGGLDYDIGRAYHLLDILRARGSYRIGSLVERRLLKMQEVREERYESARSLFDPEDELAKSGYDEVYLEGVIVGVEDYVDYNPTPERKVDTHRHRITLEVRGIEVPIYSNSYRDEPISGMFEVGEPWEFYCYVIPGDEGLHFFTFGV